MKMKTRVTEMLGIEYPIFLGGMHNVTNAQLAAAVSQAGGIGFIPAATYPSKEALTEEIRKAKKITDKPIGINISMLPSLAMGEITEQYVDVIIAEGIKVVETSGRTPKDIAPRLKEAGVKIFHKVVDVKHAHKALLDGADGIIIVGYEAGGHPGLNEVGSFVNFQEAINEIDAPIVAAGGICSGKGMLAALSMGAEGILMGTAFMATHECPIHEKVKCWIVESKTTDTMITQKSIRNPVRCIKNPYAHMVLGYEQKGATIETLLPMIKGDLGRNAILNGNLDGAQITMGQCAGLIENLMTCDELIQSIVKEAEAELSRTNMIFQE